ncbi:MAG: hypothetical protein ABSD92_01020 [Candidatus Bathyarchaeia archaeon]
MISGPNCGRKLDKPDKKIENYFFCLAVYTCNNCGNQFKASW